jgi:hypothetical protein
MQGVRLYSKKVSYDNVHGSLAYTSARALFLSSQSMLLNGQTHSRAFIFSRWYLGRYFYEMRHIWNEKTKGHEWLSRFWPETNEAYIRFWVQFYLTHNEENLESLSPEALKTSFVDNMSLDESVSYSLSSHTTAVEKARASHTLKQLFCRIIEFFSFYKAR